MKVFCHRPRENWICDRIAKEWDMSNPKVYTDNIVEADIIWLLASWCWKQIPHQILFSKKVVATIHHIVPEKFNQEKLNDFLVRDQFINLYHVPNKKTYQFLSQLTKKPIKIVGYWFDSSKWKKEDKFNSRDFLKIPRDDYYVGSFQRDTEGSDLISPKLEKGPDLFCDYIEKLNIENLHVLLGGWRRQYVISRLKESNIKFTYFELADHETLSRMYSALDLYVISSRFEGGPQSALEASGMKIPVISTDVGMTSDILHRDCIFDTLDPEFTPNNIHIQHGYEQAMNFELQLHKKRYISMFESVD